ncbi:MAG: phosphatase PAP2 family protein [Oscillospiraceae bacterium]|nr:phosphatase PAP2 family protein [Oscillospiraceae bacterium]
MDKTEKSTNRIKGYAVVIGIVYLILQHGFYLTGHYFAEWLGITPFLPKIPLDDMIPIVSVFIIPYVWSYAYWAMGPMIVSKCEKDHFADYMAANLVACIAGTLALAFFPTYMDRIAEGLYEISENPTFFEKLRMFWYSLDGSAMAYNLLPSFHCINSTLCYLGVAGRKEIPKWVRIYSLITTLLIYASTVYVKQHYFLDIITGVALAAIAYFVCKKFHWGRMFAPIERLYNKLKTANENGEHTELSCGYDCDIEDEEHPCQKNIRGNHVALCEQGRAGIARIVDSVNDSVIRDFALSRRDAMDRCIGLGKKFIMHFDKVYHNPSSRDTSHWKNEMQSWWNSIKQIKLKERNAELLNGEIRDWFLTAGANPEDFMTNADFEEKKAYDIFSENILRNNNVELSFSKTIKSEGVTNVLRDCRER